MQNSEMVLYCRLIRLKNVVAVGKNKWDHNALGDPQHRNCDNNKTHSNIHTLNRVNDCENVHLSHSPLLLRAHLKLCMQCLVDSHSHVSAH